MADTRLEPVRVSLAYRLGEVTLFERILEGLADRRHFTTVDVADGLPAVQPDSPETQFYFLPCYPVVSPPPVIVRRGGWIFYTPYSFKNYFVNLHRFETFEQYLATFSSKSRSTLRRKVKRFAESNGGQAACRVMTTREEMNQFLRLALPLSARTYQERLLSSGLPQSAAFAEQLLQDAEEGRARGYLLFDSESPVAYVLCFCRNDIASYDFVGYEPAAHAMSPGTVLQYLILESMFVDRKISIFDFTEGEGAQKELFATDSQLCAKTYVLRSTLWNYASVAVHRGLDMLSSLVGRILARWHLKVKLKRFIRRAA